MLTRSLSLPDQSSIKFDWLFNKKIDFLFFYASVLVGILCYALLQIFDQKNSLLMIAIVGTAFGAGPLHLGATVFPYLDKKNIQHFWQNPVKRRIFFYAPPIIFALTIALSFICVQLVVFVFLVWTIQHIVQQNVGILLLYHRPNSEEASVDRVLEARSMQLPALFFSLLYFHRVLMNNMPLLVLNVCQVIVFILAVLSIRMYIGSLSKQIKAGKQLNMSAFYFWLFSVFCLAPIGFMGKDYTSAFIIPLTAHWFQYLVINAVLVKRKYIGNSAYQNNLPKTHPLVLFMITCILVCMIVLSATVVSSLVKNGTILYCIVGGTVTATGLIHYFLDAFLWRFRDPFLRETVLPFLKNRALA
jgi:hypothetical protein